MSSPKFYDIDIARAKRTVLAMNDGRLLNYPMRRLLAHAQIVRRTQRDAQYSGAIIEVPEPAAIRQAYADAQKEKP